MLIEPRHRVGAAHDAFESAPGGILERLFLKPLCRVLDQFAQVLITRTMLKSISNPGTGPALLRELNDALGIGFAEPGDSIECDAHPIVGRAALRLNHRSTSIAPASTYRSEDHEFTPDLRLCPRPAGLGTGVGQRLPGRQ